MIQRTIVFSLLLSLISITASQAQVSWQFMNGPYFAEVHDLVIHPQQTDTLYAVTERGIFKTLDGAEWWDCVSLNLPIQSYNHIALDPSQPETVYATSEDQLYKTTNGGQTWQELDWSGPIFEIATTPLLPGTVFVGSDGFYSSGDGGQTFSLLSEGLPYDPDSQTYGEVQVITPDPGEPTVIYAAAVPHPPNASDGDIYRSTNLGLSWEDIGDVFTDNNGFNAITVDFDDTDTIFLGKDLGPAEWTTDGGETWTLFVSRPAKDIVLRPDNHNIMYYATGTGGPALYIIDLTNGFQWWGSEANLKLRSGHVNRVVIDPLDPDIVYIGTKEGVYKSTFPEHDWQKHSQGLVNSIQYIDSVQGPQGSVLLASNGASGLYRSVDYGATWDYLWGMYAYQMAANPENPDHILFADTWYPDDLNAFWLTTDGGESWQSSGDLIDYPTGTGYIRFDPVNTNTVYARRDHELAKSTNGGFDWQFYTLTDDTLGFARSVDLQIQMEYPHLLYAGMAHGYAGTTHGFKRSMNGGEDWNDCGLTNARISKLALCPADTALIYAAAPDSVYPEMITGLFKSSNSGQDWLDVSNDVDPRLVRDILIHPELPNFVMIATEGQGIYYSLDGAADWLPLTDFPESVVWNLMFDPFYNTILYAATDHGMYQLDLAPLAVEEPPAPQDRSDFNRRMRNYPNPFTQSTTISYHLPHPARVTIAIYNTTGRRVTTITDHFQQGGFYDVTWSGRNASGQAVAPGLYLCQLSIKPGVSYTSKLILLK